MNNSQSGTIYKFLKRAQFLHDSGIEDPLIVANKVYLKFDDYTFELLNGRVNKNSTSDLSESVVFKIDFEVRSKLINLNVKLDSGEILLTASGINIYSNENNKIIATEQL